jgi:hypothetical protein
MGLLTTTDITEVILYLYEAGVWWLDYKLKVEEGLIPES